MKAEIKNQFHTEAQGHRGNQDKDHEAFEINQKDFILIFSVSPCELPLIRL